MKYLLYSAWLWGFVVLISTLPYDIYYNRIKRWVVAHFTKLKHSNSGPSLKHEFWSGEVTLFHAKWCLTLEHEIHYRTHFAP